MKINNGDLPAMPVEEGHLYQSRCGNGSWALGALGLTKREMFAMAAMQGILASGKATARHTATHALEHADSLLAELERAE